MLTMYRMAQLPKDKEKNVICTLYYDYAPKAKGVTLLMCKEGLDRNVGLSNTPIHAIVKE